MDHISIIENKRFRREINVYLTEPDNNLYSNNNKLKIHYDTMLIKFTKNTAEFYMLIDEYIIIFISIKITNYYPFIKPIVKINNKLYNEFLNIPKLLLKEINSKYNCCHNILYNWQLTSGVYDILNDINKIFNIKLLLVRRLLCKKIVSRHFGTYLPIIEFL